MACPGGELGFPRCRSLPVRQWRPAAGSDAVPPTHIPVATDARLGGDDTQTRFVMDLNRKIDLRAFTLADPYRVVIDIPQVTFPVAAADRRERPRPDQGVPLRAGDAGRLAHRVRSHQAGAGRQGLRGRCRGRRAGAPGARSRADRSRELPAQHGARRQSRAAAEPPPASEPPSRPGDPRPLVVLDPGHGGIDTGTKAPSGELEKTSCSTSPSACATSSKRPANTAC